MKQSEVNEFIDDLNRPWQKQQCRDLIAVIRASTPSLNESLKWGQPHFDGRGAVVKLYCATGWTNVIFYRGYRLEDIEQLFEPTENERMRTWRLTPDQEVNGRAFGKLLAQAIAIDRGES